MDESGHLYEARFEKAWLFLRVYHIPTRRVVRTLRVAMNQPMFDASCWVSKESVGVLGSSGFSSSRGRAWTCVRRFQLPIGIVAQGRSK